ALDRRGPRVRADVLLQRAVSDVGTVRDLPGARRPGMDAVETKRADRPLIRVVLTGSESTGKSTLARQLAEYYAAELVPEFVRDYAAKKGAALDYSDHGPIARGQIAL